MEKELSVPGVGMAGAVMCPLFRGACLKQGCEFWVELYYEGKPVGRCALSWIPRLMVELRQSIDRLREVIDGKVEKSTKQEGSTP